jgi:hypothetical protein
MTTLLKKIWMLSVMNVAPFLMSEERHELLPIVTSDDFMSQGRNA